MSVSTHRFREAIRGGTVFILITLTTLVGSILLIALTATSASLAKKDESLKILDRLESAQSARRAEIVLTLKQLDGLPFAPCSEEYLDHARSVLVASPLIDDILAFKEGALSCSAAFDSTSPQFISYGKQTGGRAVPNDAGLDIRRGVRFDFAPQEAFTIVSNGRAAVVVHALQLPALAEDGFSRLSSLSIGSRTGQVGTYFGPETGLSREQLRDGNYRFDARGITAVSCTAEAISCLILISPWPDFLSEIGLSLAFFGLIGAITGFALGCVALVFMRRRRTLASRLRRALRQNELFLVYQPIVDVARQRTVAAEALMRWTPPGQEAIPPDIFIAAAEAGGFVNEITSRAIHLVGRDLRALLAENPFFRVCINIVIDDLADPRFRERLESDLERTGIAPSQIVFELTERHEVEVGPATEAIYALQRRGYRFYVDDFGTGYSSISYLSDIAVDAIKIDKGFTQAVGTDAARGRLVRPMIEMAHELGLEVIVEGVETETQREFFSRHNVTLMQGWLFGRPMSPSNLIATLKH